MASAGLMSEKHARHLLREACHKAGMMAAWASANDVSLAYVSDVLRGNRMVGGKIAAALGLERVVGYRPVPALPATDALAAVKAGEGSDIQQEQTR